MGRCRRRVSNVLFGASGGSAEYRGVPDKVDQMDDPELLNWWNGAARVVDQLWISGRDHTDRARQCVESVGEHVDGSGMPPENASIKECCGWWMNISRSRSGMSTNRSDVN